MNQFPFLFGTPWPFWLIVVAGAGAGALTLRGYKRRVAEVKPAKLKVLKALRMAGWALLFLCLLEPIHREFVREEKASRLTVLLDSSESMSFVDSRPTINSTHTKLFPKRNIIFAQVEIISSPF